MTWEADYNLALLKWKSGDMKHRPHLRPDEVPTRIDVNFQTEAEAAISAAMRAVEAAGASVALTDAITLLAKARDRVADHVEGKE